MDTKEHKEEKAKGFISAPTMKDLKPTEAEAHVLELLWQWQEMSARSPIQL
jgi:hypothetical protein